ncbi:MAG: DUF2953 domain-containing protein [Clostridia bacterium]|nr:DUF2953 domain-containing protein [Clostridia bacterium]
MTALWIFVGIILFFSFLLSLKATVTICYSDEVVLFVKVLFLKIKILPKKEKPWKSTMSASKAKKIREARKKKAAKKQEADKAKAVKKEQKKKEKASKPKKSMAEILDLVQLVCRLVAAVIHRFFHHLRIDVARLKVRVATGDAATTAVAYGAVTQSINVLFPLIENAKNLTLPEDSELSVEADFVSDSPELDVMFSFSLRVWHLFSVAFSALGAFLKHQFSKQK